MPMASGPEQVGIITPTPAVFSPVKVDSGVISTKA